MSHAKDATDDIPGSSMAVAGGDSVPIPMPYEQHRFHLLDALRGVAAALVVIYHPPLPPILFPESWLAVDLFFCLSGFVLCASYEQRLTTGMSMKTFVLTRMIRLYPIHLLGMALMVMDLYVQHLHHPKAASEANVLTVVCGFLLLPIFKANELSLTFPLNWPTWSLFFELVANLVYAVFLRLRIAKTAFLAAICGVSFVLLAMLGHSTTDDFNVGWGLHSFFPGFARVAYSFFAGVLLFRLYRANVRLRLTQTVSDIASVLVVALVIVCLTLPIRPEIKWAYDGCVIGVGFPALVFVGACCKPRGRWIAVCSFSGDVSYPLYILQRPIVIAIFFIFVHFGLGTHPNPVAFGMLAVLVPICWGREVYRCTAAQVSCRANAT